MKIILDFERVPMRAIYRSEFEIPASDIYTAVAQAGAMLQLQEKMRIHIIAVSPSCEAALTKGGAA